MPIAKNTLIVVNPASGGGRGRRARGQVADFLHGQGFSADFVESGAAGEVEQHAAQGARAGYGSIVALGGDGTFQQVVRGTWGVPVRLGLLPAGGGNDIAAALGIPPDPVAAAAVFLHSKPRAMDVARVRLARGPERLYLGGGGLGLDAAAAQMANGRFRHLPGAARYVAAALWALKTFRPLRLGLELDGAALETQRVMLAAVTNTPTYGAGVKIAPAAEIDDGLLDVVVVGELSWMELLEVIPPMLRTGDVRRPELRRYRARRIRLRSEPPGIFHGDGEILGETPLEIEVLPRAIQVVAPARRPAPPAG